MKKTSPSGWLLLLSILVLTSSAWGQFIVNNAVNANAGVQNVLLGGGVTASNITFQGDNAQIGSFSCGGACGLGIANGLIIGTGSVDGADGPNNSGSWALGPPDGSDGVGDVDLENLSGMNLNNTAILEFDFIPTGDSLSFNYVFSSEEYPEFVNSINDAFGFFLSGPGIAGPYT
ncbi:MAG: choice-of-anchor L domain-containing protein, partial [Flavobacteriales bacterium]